MGSKRFDSECQPLRRAVRLISVAEQILDEYLYRRKRAAGSQWRPPGGGEPPVCFDWPSPADPIGELTVRLLPDGRSRVSKDDHKPLELSRRLTEFLLFAVSGPTGGDGIVSFLSVRDAAKTLGIKKSYVATLISRFRTKLEQRGWNPNLFETIRRKPESRLRFKTKKVRVIDSTQNCNRWLRDVS
jgi:hypothetical protein